jgi:hypothetical protein
MEVLIFVIAVAVVGLLARRFGYDSRVTAPSKEEELAGFGMSRELADATPRDMRREGVPPPLAPANNTSPPHRPIRRTVARVLRALTD